MSERFYPPTEEELLKQRILTPQPSRAPYSPSVDFYEPSPRSQMRLHIEQREDGTLKGYGFTPAIILIGKRLMWCSSKAVAISLWRIWVRVSS
ncbi:hypothetical protein SAMN03159437_05436 [Pseudomonas sp. NFACC25]|nr:hypothetical protein SAMN03159437_05436 [Pseudomonas sp. NFACC25]